MRELTFLSFILCLLGRMTCQANGLNNFSTLAPLNYSQECVEDALIPYPVALAPKDMPDERAKSLLKNMNYYLKGAPLKIEDNSEDPVVVSITTSAYGQLEELIEEKHADQATELIISGPIDGSDFRAIWTCAVKRNLRILNLAAAQIKDKSIPDYALYDPWQFEVGHLLGIRKIILPDEVEQIGVAAFPFMKLEEINIPKSLKKIGNTALGYNPWLNCEIVIPEGVETIEFQTFYNCLRLTITPTLPSTLRIIRSHAFANTGIRHIDLKNRLEFIDQGAFAYTRLEKITIPESIVLLGPMIFASCFNMTQVTFSGELEEIPEGLFYCCDGISKVKFPTGTKVIDRNAFALCANLKDVSLPETLEAIGREAFSECSIDTLRLPDKVRYLGPWCFSTEELKVVLCHAQTPPVSDYDPYPAFYSKSLSNIPLYVPIGCKEKYQEQWQWNEFGKIIETDFSSSTPTMESDVETIDNLYYDLTGLKVDRPIPGHIYIRNDKKIVFGR